MIISVFEIIDIVVMTAVVGFIFMDFFKPSTHHAKFFDWQGFKYACLLTAPALIMHEMSHKFVAAGFGFTSTFHAAYVWLAIGAMLKLLRTGFIFFVPAYVSITCTTLACKTASPAAYSLIAASGPFANLFLFGLAWFLLKKQNTSPKTRAVLYLTKQINLFLFIFNMLPIPGFDGFKVFSGLISLF